MHSISKSIILSFLLFGVSFCQTDVPSGDFGDINSPWKSEGSGGPEMGPGHMGMHHMKPFLIGASQADIQSFMDIMKDKSLTKAEIQTAEDAWAASKNETVQNLYNEFKKNMTTMKDTIKNQINEKTSSLSDSAKKIVSDIEAVMDDTSITKPTEYEKIKAILDGASEADKESLKSAIPHFGNKMGHGMMGPGMMDPMSITAIPENLVQN